MRLPSLIPTSLVAGLLLASSAKAADIVPTPPRPAPGTTFSVVEIGPDTLPRSLTAELEAAAAAGLAAAGATVVARVPASPSDAPANTLLRGTCQIEGSTYRLHLMLQDAQTGATLVARDDTCEICTENDAAETANIAASALKTALDHMPRALPQPPAPSPLAPAAKPSEPGPRSGRVPWRRVLPWVAVGAGAALMGTGVYYLAINGNPTNCYDMYGCRSFNDSKAWGIEYLAAGAAVAATGLVFVFTAPKAHGGEPKASAATPQAALGVALTPNAVSAWGTF